METVEHSPVSVICSWAIYPSSTIGQQLQGSHRKPPVIKPVLFLLCRATTERTQNTPRKVCRVVPLKEEICGISTYLPVSEFLSFLYTVLGKSICPLLYYYLLYICHINNSDHQRNVTSREIQNNDFTSGFHLWREKKIHPILPVPMWKSHCPSPLAKS